ncbi:MAG: hypothetical protein IAG10_02120 [Planctomycetaceae bacterium]|nr:hypothetical protein [Planctomycetaceae bacterium]
MIRAVFEHGAVRLLDEVPGDWSEGQELEIAPAAAKPVRERQKRGYSAEEVHQHLQIKGPAPDDETVKQWIDEHRMEKYGR